MNPLAFLIMMALGTGLQMKAQADAAKRQRNAALAMQDRQDEITGRQRQDIVSSAEQYDPGARMTRQKQAADTATASIMKEIEGAMTGTNLPTEATGRVSDDYLKARADTIRQEYQRAGDRAALLGKMRAPTDLRFEEGLDNANLASRLATLSSIGKNRMVTDKAIMDSIQPNSKMMILGKIMSGVGSAGAAGSVMNGASPFTGPGSASDLASSVGRGMNPFSSNPWQNPLVGGPRTL